MKIEKTIIIYKCDKCGKEIDKVQSVSGMELCQTCFEKWDEFLTKKTEPTLTKFFKENPNMKDKFLISNNE